MKQSVFYPVGIFVALGASASGVAAQAIQQPAPVSAAPVTIAPSTVAPVIAMPRPTAETTGSQLPANTELWVSPNAEVNSKRIKQGEKFDLSVTRDVLLGDYIVIPRGTRATGQLSYRTGKGAFGKSAKMEFEVVELDLNGRMVPLRGHYRVEGQGNTGATVGAAVAVGVFSVFVTGRSAIVAQGTEFRAYTTNALPIQLAASAPVLMAPVVDNKPEAFIMPDPKRNN